MHLKVIGKESIDQTVIDTEIDTQINTESGYETVIDAE